MDYMDQQAQGGRMNYFLFIGSIVLIFVAIGFVAILNQTSSTASSTDVRAKAGTLATIKVTGTVTAVSLKDRSFTVDNFAFADNDTGKKLGRWVVTAPGGFNVATLSPGKVVTFIISPTTMKATTHTVTATEIR